MAIDVQSVLERGGEGMIKLVGYCIYKQYLDPVFLLLVKNYQMQPTAAKVTVLFEQFFSVRAPLAISLSPSDRANDRQVMDAIARINDAEQSNPLKMMKRKFKWLCHTCQVSLYLTVY